MQRASIPAPGLKTRLSLLVLAMAALALAAPPVFGQHPNSPAADLRPPPECLRFTFGTWDPPLDWARAGHSGLPMRGEQGERGRENAVRVGDGEPLLLFPSFWPVGVVIRFESATHADTLRGTATALQADASNLPSTSRVVAIRVAC